MVKLELDAKYSYVNQHTKDDANKLTDGNPNTIYTVWNPPVLPFVLTYDRRHFSSYIVRQIKYLINNGNSSNLKFYIERRDTGEKVLLLSYTGGVWIETMRTFDVPANLQLDASKFIIENLGGNDFPADMELWGDSVLSTTPLPTPVTTPISNLVGVAVKPWDINFVAYPEKGTVLKSIGIKRVRVYNDYEVNHNPDGTWNMNEFGQVDSMKALKADGISVQMCYLSLPESYPWPIPVGEDKNNPGSYLKLAQDVYALGVHSKDNGNYFDVFELLNEQDAWYHPNVQYHNDGYSLAAMCSICYDGHKGAYPGVGLKASGSTALFSSGGVAEAEPYLLYQMLEWSKANRGLKQDGSVNLPFDIYSFHCYNSIGGQYEFSNPGGAPPEISSWGYYTRLNLVRRRDCPALRLHTGEWSGGDISQTSPLSATVFGSYSAHQVSSMWTIRTMLAQAENFINAGSYYRVSQDWPDSAYDDSSVQFNTMALVRQESGGTQNNGVFTGLGMHRVMTGDYMKQAASVLFNAGYTFHSRVSGSTDSYINAPHVLKFTNGTNDLYAIWQHETMDVDLNTYGDRPQFTERTGTYNLNVTGTIRRFVDDISGTMTTENFNGGNIAYNSKPVFVVTGAGGPVNPPNSNAFFRKGWYNDEGGRIYYKHYKDGPDQYHAEYNRSYQWYKSSQ